MVVLEELDENNNVIIKNNNELNNNINNQQQLYEKFPFQGLNQEHVPIFIPNLMNQFPGTPFSFNIQIGQNISHQTFPANMMIFKQH